MKPCRTPSATVLWNLCRRSFCHLPLHVRELCHTQSFAKESFFSSQTVLKRRFDRSAVPQQFQVGDKVIALLPIPVSALSAKFSDSHDICKRHRLCYLHSREKTKNLYVSHKYAEAVPLRREYRQKSKSLRARAAICAVPSSVSESFDHPDDVSLCSSTHQSARLPNSEMLKVSVECQISCPTCHL